jgi:hypothetical protein
VHDRLRLVVGLLGLAEVVEVVVFSGVAHAPRVPPAAEDVKRPVQSSSKTKYGPRSS